MSSPPIACTLSPADLAAVQNRYRDAAGSYQATVQIDDGATIRLTGDKPALRSLLDEVIARERACCSFLTFDVAESRDGYTVRLGVNGAAGLEESILRESVATLFPGAVLA
ncbi:MAG: hypothetical protein ACRD1H_13900 [Vicinamibacterales bacterium]